MIQAISFDFWDTLAIDDSDEPERARRSLESKSTARQQAFLALVGGEVPTQRVLEAWESSSRWCLERWRVEHITPTVPERVGHALEALSLDRPEGFDAAIGLLEGMEVAIPPLPAPGTLETIPALAERFHLGIVSDTIYSPGASLREILEEWGILTHFRALVFSDEVGHSKPARVVFDAAAAGFQRAPHAIAHVGDREDKDIVGARAAGFRGVLYTGVVDRGSADTTADGVIAHHADLAPLLDRLGACP